MDEINSFLDNIKSLVTIEDTKDASKLEKSIYLMLRFANADVVNEKNKNEIYYSGEKAKQYALGLELLGRKIDINRKDIFEYISFNTDLSENIDYKETAKLYIPLDYNNIGSSLDQIYIYMLSNGIKCETKVSTKDINDNFVVRLHNIDDAIPFIEFLNNNSWIYIKNKTCNPFVPCKDGIGIVQDSGIKQSYNGAVAHLLANYLVLMKKNNFMNNVNLDDFMNYIIEYINSENDENLKFDYLCVLKGLIQIKDELDPLADITDSINNKKYY